MPAAYDVSDAVVQVALPAVAPATPAWTTIWGVTGWDADHGTEGNTRRRVFGQTMPLIRVGDAVDTYDFDGLLDLSDTNGQNLLRDSKDNGTTLLVRILPGGLGAGKKGYEQLCNVTSYGDSGDADGDFVECSFSLEGAGVKTNITLA